jgi:hypothetical protein
MHVFVLLDNTEKNILQSTIICVDNLNALLLQIHVHTVVASVPSGESIYDTQKFTTAKYVNILLFRAAPIQTDLCCYGNQSK